MRDPPGRARSEPKTKTKPEGLPEGHEPRAPSALAPREASRSTSALCQQQTFANQRSDEILNHTAVDEPPRGNEMSMEQEFYRGYRAQGVIWGIVPDSAVSLFLFLLR